MRHALLLFLVPLAAPASAQKLLHTHIGDANQLSLGIVLRAAGDVDGDGFLDYLLGAPSAAPSGPDSGEVRVHSGLTGDRIATFPGALPGDSFGTSAAGIGDVDGDGRSDLIVGTPSAGNGGRAYVVSGATGAYLAVHDAASPGDFYGTDVAGIGDVDLDGIPDYAVGAPNENTGPNGTSGAVRVYSGASRTLLFVHHGDGHVDDFGMTVRGAGDCNGDGRPDILVGAPSDDDNGFNAGAVHLVSGAGGPTLWRAFGEASLDAFGTTVDGVVAGADVNGDGVPDVIAGPNTEGYARVLSGTNGALIRRHDAAETGGGTDGYGDGLCMLRDVDGDGLGDYAIGDPFAYVLGQVRIYSGATGDELYVLTWQDQNDVFGANLAGVGDLTGDGRDEIAVGARGFDFGGIGNVGRVGIYSPQPTIGATYCTPGTAGSAGRPSSIRAYGSTNVADNCLGLTVVGMPIATFGYFVGGTGQGSFVPGGSIGSICIAGANVARFNDTPQIVRGPSGSIEVDLLAIPGNPPRPVMPGETWNFQCWFRDSAGGVATSNFSDAVSVTF